MPDHITPAGIRQTTVRDTGHQIRILRGGLTRWLWHVRIGCVCGARPLTSSDATADQWMLYNQLGHRGPFMPVDERTGAPC